jgi:hypothetical protein
MVSQYLQNYTAHRFSVSHSKADATGNKDKEERANGCQQNYCTNNEKNMFPKNPKALTNL